MNFYRMSLIIIVLFCYSCNSKNQSTGSSNNYTSVEFLRNCVFDNFYIKENKKKEFTITNIFVNSYNLVEDENRTYITGFSYIPDSLIVIDPDFYDNKITYKGVSFDRVGLTSNDLKRFQFIIYLKDYKDITKLKLYNNSERMKHNNHIQDVISFTGMFDYSDVGSGLMSPTTFVFKNCSFDIKDYNPNK